MGNSLLLEGARFNTNPITGSRHWGIRDAMYVHSASPKNPPIACQNPFQNK